MNSIPLTPENKDIWLYHFTANFPFADNPEDETMLDEFIMENYELPGLDWFDKFTGSKSEDGEESGPWNGCSLNIRINSQVVLGIEFHPYETIFFLNHTFIGNTGGHFRLSLIKWQELKAITEGRNISDIIFMMLLPLATGNAAERKEIAMEIEKRLAHEPFPFREKDVPEIARYLTNHLVFEKDVEYQQHPEAGTITDRNHSCRNVHNNTVEEIKAVNNLIQLAMNP